MSKKCAKCDKTVYPAEELKCLDKVWHKVCFKCWECGMALTMKNYKGYNKLPYCSAHYPQTRATVVADTPEQRRLAQTSLMQSQAVYHADFEKNIKGTLTSLADDPETRRVKEVTSVVSQIAYTGRQPAGNDPDSSRSEYGKDAGQENREPRTSYVPPQNPHMPSARMLPVQGQQLSSSQQNSVRSDYQQQQQQPQAFQQRQPPQLPSHAGQGSAYVAMYDYEAQDSDEVSFLENDRVIQCELIDEGWMIGTIQRTGMRGMVPANYVQRI